MLIEESIIEHIQAWLFASKPSLPNGYNVFLSELSRHNIALLHDSIFL
jgi:hypothetical protein